jgi:hypothetical protein
MHRFLRRNPQDCCGKVLKPADADVPALRAAPVSRGGAAVGFARSGGAQPAA